MTWRRIFYLFSMPAIIASVSMPASAAEAVTTEESAQRATGGTVCMAKQVGDAAGRERPFIVSVSNAKAEELKGRGFSIAKCTGVKPVENAERQLMCQVAAAHSGALKAAIWTAYSLTAQELCKNVEQTDGTRLLSSQRPALEVAK